MPQVSQAQALQRCGRAGREREGSCYRLLTAAQFRALDEVTVPEIQRSNLSGVVLAMLAIGVQDVTAFDFMDPPGREALKYVGLTGLLARPTGCPFELVPS